MKSSKLLAAVAGSLLLSVVCATSALAAYPEKPIRIIQPYAAGGITDTLARIIGDRMSRQLGQPVVVEAKPGANGNIAMEAVARSNPDGYTLLIATIANFSVSPSLYKNLRFDPLKDFQPISQLISTSNVVVVNPSLPVSTIPELIEYARANPGKINYGSSGNGSLQHLSGELFQKMTDVKIVHVPYKGANPARSDLMAGHISLMFSDTAALPLAQTGKLRALAVTSSSREPAAPHIPTVDESGLPGFIVEAWYGIAAPAGTPEDVVKKLNSAVSTVLRDPEVHKLLNELGALPAANTSTAHMENAMKSDYEKWAQIIKEADIQLE